MESTLYLFLCLYVWLDVIECFIYHKLQVTCHLFRSNDKLLINGRENRTGNQELTNVMYSYDDWLDSECIIIRSLSHHVFCKRQIAKHINNSNLLLCLMVLILLDNEWYKYIWKCRGQTNYWWQNSLNKINITMIAYDINYVYFTHKSI